MSQILHLRNPAVFTYVLNQGSRIQARLEALGEAISDGEEEEEETEEDEEVEVEEGKVDEAKHEDDID